jgi:hypothetical protein
MSVDLNRDDSVGIWIKNPEHQDERYKIRPLSPEMMRHFEIAATRLVVDPKTRQMVPETGPEHERRKSELIIDHCLEEWELPSSAGTPWPCNLGNKLALHNKYADRTNWIILTAIDFANDDRIREKAEQEAFRGVGQETAGFAVAPVRGVLETQ